MATIFADAADAMCQRVASATAKVVALEAAGRVPRSCFVRTTPPLHTHCRKFAVEGIAAASNVQSPSSQRLRRSQRPRGGLCDSVGDGDATHESRKVTNQDIYHALARTNCTRTETVSIRPICSSRPTPILMSVSGPSRVRRVENWIGKL
jgi:hypothetical protein